MDTKMKKKKKKKKKISILRAKMIRGKVFHHLSLHKNAVVNNMNINEPGHENMCLMSYALPHSLISAFVVR